ncbi:O-antigen/teichoic acid export membrane protein [Novosphingobium kunmingense]|uniref:O-antigen/teichoic acid export membrane protein n=1 Tax=Novosphingobium kunmingense TaxID=1211806 RepID=A0A2N0H6H5_9SPHN|nr:oligosaccharide flippase family protein [Novosphingobium kunmingense]PKB14544.1 O-antigen/teichoic acid export membrane protein [Novosphingobium kunmingense]
MTTRRAVAWASLGKIVSFTIAFATSIVIARFYLGPADVGLFSIAFAATTLVAVMQEFGLNRYIVGETELGDAKLRAAQTVSLLVGWAIAAVILIAAWPISQLYGDARLLPLILVVGASYLFVPFATVPIAVLHRRMDFKSDFLIEAGAAAANAGVSLVLAARGHGAMALAWGAFAQQGLRAMIAQLRAGWLLPWPLRLAESGAVFRFGSGSTLLLLFDAVAARAPDLLVGANAGPYAVGLFSRATGLAVQVVYLITGAVNSVFYPALARLRDEGRPLGDAYLRIVAGYTGVVFPAMAGLAAASHPLVAALYGPRWIEVAPILALLAAAQMILVALPLPVQIPILLGQLRGVVLRSALVTAIMVALFAVGSRWGIGGAGLAYVAFTVVSVLVFGQFVHRLIGFSLSTLFAIYMRSLLCAAAAIAPLMLAYRFYLPPETMGLFALLGLCGCGVVTWLGAAELTGHPIREEVRRAIGSLARPPESVRESR